MIRIQIAIDEFTNFSAMYCVTDQKYRTGNCASKTDLVFFFFFFCKHVCEKPQIEAITLLQESIFAPE